MNKLGNVEKFWMGFLVDLSHIKEGLLGYTSQSKNYFQPNYFYFFSDIQSTLRNTLMQFSKNSSQKISTKNMEYSLI